MHIAMIGTGYVGLVSAACLSEFGHHVVCVDKDSDKIADLNAGRIPIFEPGLDEVVAASVKARRLSFTSALPEAVNCRSMEERSFVAFRFGTREDRRREPQQVRHI